MMVVRSSRANGDRQQNGNEKASHHFTPFNRPDSRRGQYRSSGERNRRTGHAWRHAAESLLDAAERIADPTAVAGQLRFVLIRDGSWA